MERNHNDQQVVMSIEHYAALLQCAKSGGVGDLAFVQKHVRKFNPFLQAPHQEKVRKFEKTRTKRIQETQSVMAKNYRLYYAKVDISRWVDESHTPVYVEVEVKCINRQNRQLLDVYRRIDGVTYRSSGDIVQVTADVLVRAVPEDYVILDGQSAFKGLIAQKESPVWWMHQTVLARQADAAETANRKEAESTLDGARMVDAAYDEVGER